MQFEENSRPSRPGGAGGADDPEAMIGLLTSLNIIDITEAFSPPRVMIQGERLGLRAGSSMDLLTGWNFELKAERERERAIQRIEEEEPMLVIGSPPCPYISTLQELNKFNQRYNEDWLARFNDNLSKATEHIKFCIKLYRMQMDKEDTGCTNIHGRPSHGRSRKWKNC